MQELIIKFDLKILPLTAIGTRGVTIAGDIKLLGPSYFFSTYPQEWQDKYSSKRFMLSDPSILWASRNNGAKRWSEIKTFGLDGVFNAAKEYGINYGAVFATKFNKTKCFMTIARDDRDLTDTEMDVCSALLETLTQEAFEQPVLNDDYIKLLKLVAEGLDLKEIAFELGIGVTGVRYRKKKLFGMLGVDNEMQAVRAAMRRNILD